jgi:alanine racemase
VTDFELPARLILDEAALAHNWRALKAMGGPAACGAAVKADGYGLGAVGVVERLARAGCRDFFVATWAEAAALAPFVQRLDLSLSVLHGVREADMTSARTLPARPVLNTPEQVARWTGQGPCDVMVDTGMNRLGVAPDDLPLAAGLPVETLMSHLACAEEAVPMNAAQRGELVTCAGSVAAKRLSLANSAGIALGADYAFDLTRPGLALYGGVPCDRLAPVLRRVVSIEAQVLQRRRVPAGATVGYNATWTAPRDTDVAIVNLGYADGFARALHAIAVATFEGGPMPILGRISMDLIALDATEAAGLREGDWVRFEPDLPAWAEASGRTQYELLTALGTRFERRWA